MEGRNRSYRHFSAIIVALLFVLSIVRGGEIKQRGLYQDAKKLCAQRSGHRHNFVQDVKWRNNDCAVDCIMHQGIVLSYNVPDGTSCLNDDYKCVLGSCRGPDELEKPREKLNSVQIKIISACVQDRDQSPIAGESDAFVMVEVVRGGEPSYRDNDDLCFTYIIQDNNHPRWKDFTCKPLPISNKALLRFSAFDSDKPFNQPDPLGYAEEELENLINQGKKTLTLVGEGAGGYDSPFHIEVEVTGQEYDVEWPTFNKNNQTNSNE